jgi:predicted RNA-binding Zn-ribbon protein involved in translation (DUF1610 family)
VLLGESDRLLRCAFCKVNLFICGSDAPRRLYLPPRSAAAVEEDLSFIPYWRIKGIHYSRSREGLRHAFLDKTRLAADAPGLARSLGVRPQAVPLHFVTEETRGSFLEPTLPIERVLGEIETDLRDPDEPPPLWTALIGETMSIVYLPVRRNGGLFDAVSGRRIETADRVMDAATLVKKAAAAPSLRFVSTLCPTCGWEMAQAPTSLLLHCPTCGTVWEEAGGRFRRRSVRIGIGGADGDWYLPFWRFASDPALRPSSLWVAAFKVHADHALRLARTFTTTQVDSTESPVPRGATMASINLPPGEGFEAARVLALEKGWNAQAGAMCKEPELVLIPFREAGAEVARTRPRCALAKNLLAFGLGL